MGKEIGCTKKKLQKLIARVEQLGWNLVQSKDPKSMLLDGWVNKGVKGVVRIAYSNKKYGKFAPNIVLCPIVFCVSY